MSDIIQDTLTRLKKSFKTGKTRGVEWRKQQLRQLKRGMNEMLPELTGALEKDLGKSPFLTELSSIYPCIWDVDFSLDHIDEFMKDDMRDTPALMAPASTFVRYEPLGVVLIFGSWNYPYVVNLKPLCQAITSGNCAVIKPSEFSPHSSAAIKKLVEKYLDKDCYSVIEGGPEIAAKISGYPWDLICFTGSTIKGKLVAEAAAKNLVPCILELGGKCPAIIDQSCDVDFAAAKICFARFNNSGQTCLATDYIFVHEAIQQQFLDRLQFHIKNMYGGFENGSPDMGKVITEWHCDRLKNLIETGKGKILCGGKVNSAAKYVEPTVIINPDPNSPVMQEEIFGPVLPVYSFKEINPVIDFINNKDKPLTVYYFGKCSSNPIKDRLLNETSSGSFVVNEALVQIVNHEFGFGGVGPSGYGRYGGYDGFKQWSNPKSVMIKPTLNFYPYNQLNPPFPENKKKLIKLLAKLPGTQNQFISIMKWTSIILVTSLIFYFYHSCVVASLKKGCSYLD